jgi:rsbT antagonist protein RsbS
MSVTILQQGDCLVASVESDLDDEQILELRDQLAARVGSRGVRGVVIDVSALEVIDSFVAQSLQSLTAIVRLRGVSLVVAGIQPEVAVAMVHFSLDLATLRPALDLDQALAMLRGARRRGGARGC